MCKVMRTFFLYMRIFMDKTIDFFFSLYWERKKRPIPDLDKKYAFLADSATTLARKIKQKELKSEELVQAVIERIKVVNPIINAIAEERYEAALEDARQVDRLVAAGLSDEEARKKPFLGVPFTTKESQAIKGFKLTMGLWSRRNERADDDSTAVARLKEAGALPLAASNLPELLIWQETRNPIYGMTNNPHHTGRSPGGSSGAEAALTSCYASTISLCSDLGGSTRMPAFYCGMFGHHPTAGTTDLKGVFFRKGGEESMFSLGFITKHVEDLAPLTKVIAGDKASMLNLDRDVNIKVKPTSSTPKHFSAKNKFKVVYKEEGEDIKFFYTEAGDDTSVSPIRPELKNAMKRVISKISQEITTTTNSPQPYYHEGFNHMYKLWAHWMTKEPDNYASLYHNGNGEASAIKELVKKLLGFNKHCFFTIMQLLEKQVLPGINAEWADKLSMELKDDLFSKLGDTGVLMFPSAPQVTPYHYSCVLRPYNFAYWALVNALKCPSTQVPLGVNEQGLPVGIQVIAAPYNDALCLTVAKYLEKEFGGAVMPCKIKQ